MKKNKLNSVLASILSLTVVCSSSVCASGGDSISPAYASDEHKVFPAYASDERKIPPACASYERKIPSVYASGKRKISSACASGLHDVDSLNSIKKCVFNIEERNIHIRRKNKIEIVRNESIIINDFKYYKLNYEDIICQGRKLKEQLNGKVDSEEFFRSWNDIDIKSAEALSMSTARMLVTLLDRIKYISKNWDYETQYSLYKLGWNKDMLDHEEYVEIIWSNSEYVCEILKRIITYLEFCDSLKSEKKMFVRLLTITKNIDWIFGSLDKRQ